MAINKNTNCNNRFSEKADEKLLSKRLLNKVSIPLTEDNKEAKKYKELEELKEPRKTPEEVNISKLLEAVDKVDELTVKEFYEKYTELLKDECAVSEVDIPTPPLRGAPEKAAYLEHCELVIDTLDAKIDELANPKTKKQLESLKKEKRPEINKIVEEAQAFFEHAEDTAFGATAAEGKEEREEFLKNIKAFGLTYEKVDEHGNVVPGEEGDLREKGRIARQLRLKQKEFKRKDALLKKEKRKLQELTDAEKEIKEQYEKDKATRWKVFKGIGMTAAVVAAGATILPLIPAALGITATAFPFPAWLISAPVTNAVGTFFSKTVLATGLQHIVTGALMGAAALPGLKYLKGLGPNKLRQLKSIHFSKLATLERETEAARVSTVRLTKQLKDLEEQEKINKGITKGDYEELKARRQDTVDEINNLKDDLKAKDLSAAERTAVENRLKELRQQRQTLDDSIMHYERLMALHEVTEKHKEHLSDEKRINTIISKKYLPATGPKLQEFFSKQAKEEAKVQIEIGDLSPKEAHESIESLTNVQRRAVVDYLSSTEFKHEANDKPDLTEIEPLKGKAEFKALYDLCVRLPQLPEENPFRKKAKEELEKALDEAKKSIENVAGVPGLHETTLDRLEGGTFGNRFKEPYIVKDGMMKEKGLHNVAKKVLGPDNSLLRFLDHKDLDRNEIEEMMIGRNTAKVPDIGFTLQEYEDLKKVLDALEGDQPKYLIGTNGTFEKYDDAQARMKREADSAYGTLDTPLKNALERDLKLLTTHQNDVAFAGRPAAGTPLVLPAVTTETSVSQYLNNLTYAQLITAQKLFLYIKDNMVPAAGRLENKVERAKTELKTKITGLSFGPGQRMAGFDTLIKKDPDKHFKQILTVLQRDGTIAAGLSFRGNLGGLVANLDAFADAQADTDNLELIGKILDAMPGKVYVNTIKKTPNKADWKHKTDSNDWHFESYKETYTELEGDVRYILATKCGGLANWAAINEIRVQPGGVGDTNYDAAFSDFNFDGASMQIALNNLDPDNCPAAVISRLATMSHNIAILRHNFDSGRITFDGAPNNNIKSVNAITYPSFVGHFYRNDNTEIR